MQQIINLLKKSLINLIKPLYDIISEIRIQFGVLHEDLSIYESMVPYFRRHSCKQFIRGKLFRFGYKIQSICSSSGIPYRVVIYEGKADNAEGQLGIIVVLDLLTIYEDPRKHHIYMDNFFSSYDLYIKLKDLNFRATGMVKENRLKECTIMSESYEKEREVLSITDQGEIQKQFAGMTTQLLLQLVILLVQNLLEK